MGALVRSFEVIAFPISLFLLLLHLHHLLLMSSTCDARAVLCHPEERAALRQFKDGLSEAGMISSWGVEEEDDCCSWNRVACDNRTGHVVELNLHRGEYYYSSPTIRSKISPYLVVLKHLQRLDLSGNNFGFTSIPPFLGSLESLTYLNLSHAGFAGVLPQQLGNLSRLQVLDLSGNYEIESNFQWLSHLHRLQYLDMSYMNLTSANNLFELLNVLPYLKTLHLSLIYYIADFQVHLQRFNSTSLRELVISGDWFMNSCWFSNITSVEYLHLDFDYIQVDGCPNGFTAKLCNLKSLILMGDAWPLNITGDLNQFFTECDHRLNLISLDLSFSYFTGQLPEWLGDYKSLQTLNLQYINLWGYIPESIGGMTSLKELDISRNNLMGSIPQSIGGLQSLEHLELSRNDLMGSIPLSIGRLRSLKYLSIYENNLSGSIPQTIGGLRSLKRLYLFSNSLMGSIPQSIGMLQFLEHLDISGNNLSGPLPSSLGELKSLQELYLRGNRLQGKLSEEHFAHLGNLTTLDLSSNPFLQVTLSPHWVPPFRLYYLYLGSCKVGPDFPLWLQTQNKLYDLNMSDSGISDVIPWWISSFSSLILYMDLSMNKLSGVVPAATNLSRISSVNLHSNMLQGSLLSFPRTVETLWLSDNLFSGRINIDMSSIQALSLSRNNFTGSIPPSFCEAKGLLYLDLSHNRLYGQLPSCSANQTCGIKSLHLNNNSLHGALPAWLWNCTSMGLLDIGENNISGEIPNWISNGMLQLKVLRLRSNSFYGSVPVNLSNLTSLHVLDLANNSFSGPIPRTFGNFTAMKTPLLGDETLGSYLGGYYQESISVPSKGGEMFASVLKLYASIDLSGNKLSGGIPAEVGRLLYLRNMNLSHNHLTGCIPDTLANLSQLEILDLSSNNLSGGIPETLSRLTSLSNFNVSYNHLSGKIPSGQQFDTFTNSSYIGNVNLCGEPLKVCQSDLSPPIKGYSVQTDQKDRYYFLWLSLSVVLGFTMGLWTFLGTLFFKSNWRRAYFQFVDNRCEKYYLLAKIYMDKCKRMSRRSR